MEDDSEVAMPETTTAATTTTSAVNSKSGNKGENEESKQKKKVMTIGSTSIIPLKGADVSMSSFGGFKHIQGDWLFITWVWLT